MEKKHSIVPTFISLKFKIEGEIRNEEERSRPREFARERNHERA